MCWNDNTYWEVESAGWGLWNWCREASLKVCLYWDTSTCSTGGELPNPDYANEFDFVGSIIPEGGEGIANLTWNGSNHFKNVDIRIRDGIGTLSPQSFGISTCNTIGLSMALGLVHEVGHAYGLDHDDTYTYAMNTIPHGRHCTMGVGWREQPFGDDMAGALSIYGRNTDNIYNMSGSAVYRDASNNDMIDPVAETDYCGGGVFLEFTLNNVYKALASYQFQYRFAITSWFEESPESSDVVWWGPAFAQNPSGSNATVRKAINLYIDYTALSPATPYRVWVVVDPYQHYSETDELDNWIPLNALIMRGQSCN